MANVLRVQVEPVPRTTTINAEIAKIAETSLHDSKFSGQTLDVVGLQRRPSGRRDQSRTNDS
jgi:hypothetical protein